MGAAARGSGDLYGDIPCFALYSRWTAAAAEHGRDIFHTAGLRLTLQNLMGVYEKAKTRPLTAPMGCG